MDNIFSLQGKNSLKNLSKYKTVYCFDFDGTLAKIVSTPSDAKLKESTENLLLEIKKCSPIAIITGRSSSDLRKLLNFEPNFIIGNHGIEGLKSEKDFLNECKITTKIWIQKLSNLFDIEPLDFELEIEDKEFSISLHYKDTKKNGEKNDNVLELTKKFISKLEPLPKVIQGKFVLNLMPSLIVNKGTALIDLMETNRFSHALYIGDDVTDEDVFKINNENILTIHVGNNNNSKAKFYLQEQAYIDQLLKEIKSNFT